MIVVTVVVTASGCGRFAFDPIGSSDDDAPPSADAFVGPDAVLSSGLVGYWPFDQQTGGQTPDRSPSGNNGTIGGTAMVVPGAGILDGALILDGGAGVVDLQAPSVLEFPVASFTLAMWVNPTGELQAGLYTVILRNEKGAIIRRLAVAD